MFLIETMVSDGNSLVINISQFQSKFSMTVICLIVCPNLITIYDIKGKLVRYLKCRGGIPPVLAPPTTKGGGGLNTNLLKIARKNGTLGIRTDIYVHGWDQW